MKVEQIYTGCLAEAAYYIESNGEAAIIDPMRETEPYLERLKADGAKLKYVLETHFHADFVSGHLDLANDLERLADIHQRSAVRARVARDSRHSRPDDVTQARALARTIFSGLGLGSEKEHERWSDLCQRAWTLLLREYEVHRAAGIFLLRDEEDVTITYPSLVTASRARPRRTAGTDLEPDLEPDRSPSADEGTDDLAPVEAAVA